MLLRLENITYARAGRAVLSDLDLDLADGTTALVGPSGSGKSTLLRLLNRLADPNRGTVAYEDRDVRDYDVLELTLRIMATDVDEAMLERARWASYGAGSLRELPGLWQTAAFARIGDELRLRGPFRATVTVARHDVRDEPPAPLFDLVLCRNLAFTYFDADVQRATATRLARAVRPGGALVIGTHETLPLPTREFEPWTSCPCVYRRAATTASPVAPADR